MKRLSLQLPFSQTSLVFAFCVTTAIFLPAQTFTTLLSFGRSGQYPQYMSLVQASTGGALYGTTYSGGSHNGGTVFKLTPLSSLPMTLYSFCAQLDCSDGQAPDWGLVKSANGNFYGMTVEGGVKGYCLASGCGTVFEITPSGALTTIYSFCAQPNCSDGASPAGPLLWTSRRGALYGATELGGITSNLCNGSCGTIFTIPPKGKLSYTASVARTGAGLMEGWCMVQTETCTAQRSMEE